MESTTIRRSRTIAPSDFGGNLCSDGAFEQAERDGNLEVILPKENELLIDIDSDAHELLFHKNLPKIDEYVGVQAWMPKPSRSGEPERKHITVELRRAVTPLERILLQAVLGSDLRRELLSYCRWTIDDPHPTLFFEKKFAGFLPPAKEEPKALHPAGSSECPCSPCTQCAPEMIDGVFTEANPYE